MYLEINNVTKTIHHNTVIDSISLKADLNQVIGLQGINGSGKTMLLRLISGLIQPTGGEIKIDNEYLGKDISFPPSIGVLIENPAFIDSYSALDNLKLIAYINQIAEEKSIKETICRVGLDPDEKKKYKKFSLGMKQRLGIAAAIMEHPELLLLDEPTNALDASGVSMLKEIVRKEKERGSLIVITCHDSNILNEISDKIYCMEQGKIVSQYEPMESEIYES